MIQKQKPISTRLRRFVIAMNHARTMLNAPKTSYLEKLVSKERYEIALFAREEDE